tara:strand:+ start:365 stop:472 length:108 start_codon:yes stop_codon:yes gene_type:complete
MQVVVDLVQDQEVVSVEPVVMVVVVMAVVVIKQVQ